MIWKVANKEDFKLCYFKKDKIKIRRIKRKKVKNFLFIYELISRNCKCVCFCWQYHVMKMSVKDHMRLP